MVALRFVRLAAPAAVLAIAVCAPTTVAQADASMPNPSFSPDENQPNDNQVTLGKFLFWEEQISSDNTMACGTCHIHEAGGSDPRTVTGNHPGPDGLFGTDDDVGGSAGVVSQNIVGKFADDGSPFFPHVGVTGRRAPTSINAGGGFDALFWDGRATGEFADPVSGETLIFFGGGLESQAAGPPLSTTEMGAVDETWTDIANKIVTVKPMALGTDIPDEMVDFQEDFPDYPAMFNAAYGSPEITPVKIIYAIANYERTLVSDQTPFDVEVLLGGGTMSDPDLEAGHQLFKSTTANCTSCHVFPFTANGNFHNIGVTDETIDPGRSEITLDPADIGKFKTPNIRNAVLRTPLFHDGSAQTVREVVEFYSDGGDFANANLDPDIEVLDLTEAEIDLLVNFIEVGLTDPRVANREFPFTRPTLHSELESSNTVYGTPGLSGTGTTMDVIATVPANIGNPNLLMGVANATPNEIASLAMAWNDADGAPFPDPRFPVPMNVDAASIFNIITSSTDPDGVATAKINVPLETSLQGLKFYWQMFVSDALAGSGGVYGSEGVEAEIF